MKKAILTNPEYQGKIDLTGIVCGCGPVVIIGRDSEKSQNQVEEHDELSRLHSRLKYDGTRFIYSENGNSTPLTNGSQISIFDKVFVYEELTE